MLITHPIYLGDLPKVILDVLKNHPEQAVVAGGYYAAVLDSRVPKDIDIFVPDQPLQRSVATAILGTADEPDYFETHETDFAFTITSKVDPDWIPVQVIIRKFSRVRGLLNSFDLSASQAAVYCKLTGALSFAPPAPTQLQIFTTDAFDQTQASETHDLILTREDTPYDTFYRAIKYAGYGYTITPTVLARLVKLSAGVGNTPFVSHLAHLSVSVSSNALASLFEGCPTWKGRLNGKEEYPEPAPSTLDDLDDRLRITAVVEDVEDAEVL